jgi:hypothetical protein
MTEAGERGRRFQPQVSALWREVYYELTVRLPVKL